MISIIVPIYNVEDYLPRCIDSLREQEYRDIEIILVNDGSTDKCSYICDNYAQKDSRIKVVHKINGGLSDARNAGLACASGEYIAFVDSDDWVSPYYLSELYTAMKKSNADIVECEKIITTGKVHDEKIKKDTSTSVYGASQALHLLIEDHIFHQTVWNKLYTRKVIGDIKFAVGKYNEDEFWTYQIFGRADKIAYIDRTLYYYFQRPSSLMGVGYNLRRLDAIEAKALRQIYIEKHYPELEVIARTNLMFSIIYAGQMSLRYLGKKEREKSLKRLNAVITGIFMKKKSQSFYGKISHVIWCQSALINLKSVCRIRNILHINI